MHRKNTHAAFGKSFDSFLSIVTKNGLGMLILIAMASTFTTQQTLSQPKFRRSIGTPMIKLAAEGAREGAFECAGGRVFPIDLKVISKAHFEFFEGFFRGSNMDQLAAKLNGQAIPHEYYRFEFKARCGEPNMADLPAIYLHPRANSQGEDLAQLQKPDSRFQKSLRTLDKKKDVVFLIVRPDSFPFFRELRDWLQKEAYQIGWEPREKPLFLPVPSREGPGRIPID